MLYVLYKARTGFRRWRPFFPRLQVPIMSSWSRPANGTLCLLSERQFAKYLLGGDYGIICCGQTGQADGLEDGFEIDLVTFWSRWILKCWHCKRSAGWIQMFTIGIFYFVVLFEGFHSATGVQWQYGLKDVLSLLSIGSLSQPSYGLSQMSWPCLYLYCKIATMLLW